MLPMSCIWMLEERLKGYTNALDALKLAVDDGAMLKDTEEWALVLETMLKVSVASLELVLMVHGKED